MIMTSSPAVTIKDLKIALPAGGDRPSLGQQVPEPDGLPVRRLVPLGGMPAHHADQASLSGPVRQRLVDRMVVQRLRQGPLGIARLSRPGVDPRVQRVAVRP